MSNAIKLYDELLAKPYGLILVVGPTGSGKNNNFIFNVKSIEQCRKKIY